MAALCKMPATTQFAPNLDIDNGGLMLALPALLSNGLLDSLSEFEFKQGFYRIQDIMLVTAFMVLARVENINKLGLIPPGEWGKLLGVDRIPEKETLREKLDDLSHGENKENLNTWITERSTKWMEENDDVIGQFFVDGHVRTYYGKTKLPRRYVSRARLCLRGMTDFWVNDQKGQPFFAVTTPFSKGLMEMMKKEIIPKLLADVPNQRPVEELKKDPANPYKFLLVFDREGYSMAFFKDMWEKHRIACQTYHKYPKSNWEEKDFAELEVSLPFGTVKKIKLADKSIYDNKNKFTYREIRELTETGHQIAVVTMNFTDSAVKTYCYMDSRTSQENFFRYARQDYNIDTLNSFEKEAVDDTEMVVNPQYRQLEKALNSNRGKLARRVLVDKNLILKDNPTEKEKQRYEEKKSELRKGIEELESTIKDDKKTKKKIEQHIMVKELPEEYHFLQFHGGRKKIIDIIKMISYRAETSMSNIILPELTEFDRDTSKAIIKSIFQTPANIKPDYTRNLLRVELHYTAKHKHDKIIQKLMDFLNKTEFRFPGTSLRLFYDFVSF